MVSRIAIFIVAIAAMLVSTSCPQEITGALAIKGPKKYKAEVLSCTSNITAEIDAGEVTKGTISKFDGILTRYKNEFGTKGTYMVCVEIQDLLHKGAANPGETFKDNQEARGKIEQLIDYFKTEVPD